METVKRFLSKFGTWLKVGFGALGLLAVWLYATIRSARREGEARGSSKARVKGVRDAEARGDEEAVRRELLR